MDNRKSFPSSLCGRRPSFRCSMVVVQPSLSSSSRAFNASIAFSFSGKHRQGKLQILSFKKVGPPLNTLFFPNSNRGQIPHRVHEACCRYLQSPVPLPACFVVTTRQPGFLILPASFLRFLQGYFQEMTYDPC